MRTKKALLPLIIVLSLPAFSQTVSQTRGDAEIAGLYLEASRELYAQQNYAQMLETAQQSLSFDSHNAAGLFFKAIGLEGTGQIKEALAAFQEAVDADYRLNRFGIRREDAVLSFAALLVRVKQYEKAETLLMQRLDMRDPVPGYYQIHADLLTAQGRTGEAVALLHQGYRRYPDNQEILLQLVKIDRSAFNQATDLVLQFPDQASRALTAELLSRTKDIGTRKELLRVYKEQFSEDPNSMLSEWMLDGEATASQINIFLDRQPLEWTFLNRARTVLENTNSWEVLLNDTADFSGTVVTDTNYDSHFEIRSQWTDGLIELMTLDRNQDNRPEWEIHFTGGKPATVAYRTDDTTYIYDLMYPFIKSCIVISAEKSTEFHLLPFSEVLPVLAHQGTTVLDPPVIKEWIQPPTFQELRSSARRIKESEAKQEDSSQLNKVTVNSTEFLLVPPYTKIEYHYSDDMRVFKQDSLIDGFITRSEEDRDGDGFYELVRSFNNGKEVSISLDEDADGKSEYIRFPGSPSLELWDISSDGVYDIRRFTGDKVIYDYTSRFDGRFDTRLTVEDGTITQAIRRNETLSIFKKDGYYLIGSSEILEIPRNLIMESTGKLSFNGISVYIFFIEGLRCVEVLY